ncbi:AAA family ATPase [Amorphus sp. 3PC139-8]|uniref:AAA family ATPase n=1 Tax=Amorphus sp. 3PC139-8 TaxID=2735676 RepID=UPI00345CC518
MNSGSTFFIVTGGPGSGKTTLMHALSARGYPVTEEAGRAIIRAQTAIDGPALPWADRTAFAELMLSWEIRSHEQALVHAGPVIFDRGVPDVAGYLTLCGLPVPDHVARAVAHYRYASTVFVAPPWSEIFGRDNERKQDFDEAVRTHAAMVATYGAAGYDLVELPRAPVETRADFVISRLT